ncbi:hypothetical protein FQZ97_451390 [compost metagenome]
MRPQRKLQGAAPVGHTSGRFPSTHGQASPEDARLYGQIWRILGPSTIRSCPRTGGLKQRNAVRKTCQQLAGQRPLRFGPLGSSQRRGQPSPDVPFAETGTPDVYEATEPSYVAPQLKQASRRLPVLAARATIPRRLIASR